MKAWVGSPTGIFPIINHVTFNLNLGQFLNYLTNSTNISDFLKGEAAYGTVKLQSYNSQAVEPAPQGKVT